MIRRAWVSMLSLTLAGWIAGLPALAQAPAPAPAITRDSVAAFFSSAFPLQRLEHEIPGYVVAVVYRGEVLYLGGFGWADIAARVPADPERSLFRIASITKTFVWTGLMQLVEQGRMGLDDPVQDYLDFELASTFAEPIRVRHLLTHTAGFEERGTGTAARSAAELTPLGSYLAENQPALVRPPGQQASYSNYGAALAGYLIERVSGQSWADYVDDHILEPLAMTSTNTHSEMADALRARHATSYRFRAGRFEPLDYLYARDAPAGHMSTTAADMARYMLAHLGHARPDGVFVFSPRLVAAMREPLFAPDPAVQPLLHGFYRSDRNGLAVYGHGGDVNGFHSNLSLLPDLDLGIFVSFNSDPSAVARSNIVPAFIDYFFPAEILRTAPAPAEVAFDDLMGEYLPLRRNWSTFERLGSLVNVLQVASSDGQLLLGGGASRWVAIAPDRFVALYSDRSLVAQRDANGKTYLMLETPLATFERVRGIDAPSTQRVLFGCVAAVYLLAVVGWGWRAIRRAPAAAALPRVQVGVAWAHALLGLYLIAQLARALSGDVEEFQFGVPPEVHRNLILMSLNLLAGALVVVFAVLQWLRGAGSVAARLRYDLVALAALLNALLAVCFNYAGYAFS
ncbi:MAG: serine hydrolase domain-containing protein [Pseudomonadales bacterium]